MQPVLQAVFSFRHSTNHAGQDADQCPVLKILASVVSTKMRYESYGKVFLIYKKNIKTRFTEIYTVFTFVTVKVVQVQALYYAPSLVVSIFCE
jgi:hypothetical protein